MARIRRGKPINGWIAVDKPAGITSAGVVAQVKRATGAAKVGHGGTLDPLATGVLPIALGEATKTVQYVMDGTKVYAFRIRWGEARDTDDAEGAVTETSDLRPSESGILAALPRFIGAIEQVPPDYSAIKVNGRRAYDLAREATEMVLKARTVVVGAFELRAMPDADNADFVVTCGKGTYMRSLARDLARAVGTVGHICALRRTACGPFVEERAISLDKLVELGHSATASDYLLPVSTALDDIPALALTEEEAHRLSNGQPVSFAHTVARNASMPNLSADGAGGFVRAVLEGKLVALARIEDGEIRPIRVLNH